MIDVNSDDKWKLYLIDFGIAKQYWNFEHNKHVQITSEVPFVGTFRFASKNHHCLAFSQSRRDDIESLLYVIIYLYTNHLPWIVDFTNKPHQFSRKGEFYVQTKLIKQQCKIHQLCKNLPVEFTQALNYISK